MSKDYEVTVKIRNARLLRKMREYGIETGIDLAERAGINHSSAFALLNLKQSALKIGGGLRSSVDKICVLLKCMPEDIIPAQHMEHPLRKNISSFEANLDEVEALVSSLKPLSLESQIEQREARWTLQKTLDGLPPRLANVIILKYGLNDGKERTLEEIGKELGVTRERIRQMEARALRKMKEHDVNNKKVLRSAMEAFN